MKILLVVASIVLGFILGLIDGAFVWIYCGKAAKDARLKYLKCCETKEFISYQEQNEKYIEISNLNQMLLERIIKPIEYEKTMKAIKFPR